MAKIGTNNNKLVTFSVLLDKELLDLLKEIAKREDRSLSAQARRYIEQGINDETRSS